MSVKLGATGHDCTTIFTSSVAWSTRRHAVFFHIDWQLICKRRCELRSSNGGRGVQEATVRFMLWASLGLQVFVTKVVLVKRSQIC
jgi:hypothetical protein